LIDFWLAIEKSDLNATPPLRRPFSLRPALIDIITKFCWPVDEPVGKHNQECDFAVPHLAPAAQKVLISNEV